MSDEKSGTAGRYQSSRTQRVVQHVLAALTTAAIVGAFAVEAHELAGEFGAVAYSLVLGIVVVSFLVARVGWQVLTGYAEAAVAREEAECEATVDA